MQMLNNLLGWLITAGPLCVPGSEKQGVSSTPGPGLPLLVYSLSFLITPSLTLPFCVAVAVCLHAGSSPCGAGVNVVD